MDQAFHLVSVNGADGLIASPEGTAYIPLAAVVCDDCHETSFFNLMDMGVFEK